MSNFALCKINNEKKCLSRKSTTATVVRKEWECTTKNQCHCSSFMKEEGKKEEDGDTARIHSCLGLQPTCWPPMGS